MTALEGIPALEVVRLGVKIARVYAVQQHSAAVARGVPPAGGGARSQVIGAR